MDQGWLFKPSMQEASGLAPALPAKARHTDPQSSHEAARKVTRSGQAQSDREAILAVLRSKNGLTAGEIARELGEGWTNVRVSRRTPEMEETGKVRRGAVRDCQVKNTSMVTWWVI